MQSILLLMLQPLHECIMSAAHHLECSHCRVAACPCERRRMLQGSSPNECDGLIWEQQAILRARKQQHVPDTDSRRPTSRQCSPLDCAKTASTRTLPQSSHRAQDTLPRMVKPRSYTYCSVDERACVSAGHNGKSAAMLPYQGAHRCSCCCLQPLPHTLLASGTAGQTTPAHAAMQVSIAGLLKQLPQLSHNRHVL